MPIFMPHWPKPIGNRPMDFIDLGLDRVLELLNRLGNPHLKIPNVIHVAGTNGKGSTIAFLKKILEDSGYKVHAYTSPHLVYFNERIVVASNQITDSLLYDALEECRIASSGIKLTFFEGTTVAALLAFSQIQADFTILETGMGGMLDATNVVDPLISIITPISFDHVEYLGNSLQEIAYEKSGIMKKDSLCIISKQPPEALKVMEDYSIHIRSSIYRFGHEWACYCQDEGSMIFETGGEAIEFPMPSLRGDHQAINAGNAIACATILHNKFGYKNITNEIISSSLTNTYWPARLEPIISPYLFTNICDIFLDGAHNVGGAKMIANWLGKKKACFILGMTRGKDTVEFLKEIKNNTNILCSVCVQSEPRSQTTSEIKKSAQSIRMECIENDGIQSAVQYIIETLKSNTENKPTIIICGSLFLAKDLYELL